MKKKNTLAHFEDYTADAHLSGRAKCLHCGKKWVATAPVGEISGLECPRCKLPKGVLVNLCHVDEGALYWKCQCGCDVFILTATHPMCVACGTPSTWEPYLHITGLDDA